MKKSFAHILTGGLFLLLALMGCGKSPAAVPEPAATEVPIVTAAATTAVEVRLETAAPEVTPEVLSSLPDPVPTPDPDEDAPEDEDRILGHCISVVDALPYAVDLDGDGTMEVVDLTTLPGTDGLPRWTVSVQRGEEVKLSQTWIMTDMPYDLWVGDLDEDGRYELFFHGDMASNDYLIYAWRCDLTPILFESDDRYAVPTEEQDNTVFGGSIDGFEDGHIVVQGVVDMLGTHWGVRTMAIGDDGVIGPVSTVWEFSEEDDRFLTVKKELTAYAARVRKDPGEAFRLQPGEKLYPLASDGYSRLWFRTESGKTGVLLLTRDAEHMWLVDGVPEADYFDTLPYAG